MITITINTNNAAFEDNSNEVTNILENLAQLSAYGGWKQLLDDLKLRDRNGNTIGKVEIS